MRAVQITWVSLLVVLLAACTTVPQDRVDFGSVLAQTTHEITAAANAIADAADAGLVDRASDEYQTVRTAFLTAATYLELAWAYYADGNLFEAQSARQAALGAYLPMREYLIKLQEGME